MCLGKDEHLVEELKQTAPRDDDDDDGGLFCCSAANNNKGGGLVWRSANGSQDNVFSLKGGRGPRPRPPRRGNRPGLRPPSTQFGFPDAISYRVNVVA